MRFSINFFSLFFILYFTSIKAQFNFQLKDSVALPQSNNYQLKINSKSEIFIIQNYSQLIKINRDLSSYYYSQNKIISHFDGHLSLKNAVIYNHQELQFLDDKLNPIQNPINLNQYQIYPSAISIIDNQLLWYFDPIEQRLIQWNYQTKETINKSGILFFKPEDSTIEELYTYKNRIFLKSQNWIYEYDFFGNFKSEIAIPKNEKHSFSSSYIYLLNQNMLTEINLMNHEISSTDNFFYGKDFIMDDDQLFVIKDNLMYIYTRIKN